MEWLDREGLLLTPEFSKIADPEGSWRWHRFWDNMIKTDWGGMKRFADDNRKIGAPKPGEQRVVFLGNSITEGWIRADSAFFNGRSYVNRGIGGQTTGQMLIRFRQDVLDLQPAVVVILAGTNDIAGNTGETTLETTFGNIVSMVELAKTYRIRVVLSSVVPAYDYPWAPGIEPAEKVVRLNAMLKNYAENNDCIYLDYFSAMADFRNGLPPDLARDGVHPTLDGYKIMEPLAEKAIQDALMKK